MEDLPTTRWKRSFLLFKPIRSWITPHLASLSTSRCRLDVTTRAITRPQKTTAETIDDGHERDRMEVGMVCMAEIATYLCFVNRFGSWSQHNKKYGFSWLLLLPLYGVVDYDIWTSTAYDLGYGCYHTNKYSTEGWNFSRVHGIRKDCRSIGLHVVTSSSTVLLSSPESSFTNNFDNHGTTTYFRR